MNSEALAAGQHHGFGREGVSTGHSGASPPRIFCIVHRRFSQVHSAAIA
jgi:hypothetical protein